MIFLPVTNDYKGISIPTPFFPLKWSKSEYEVRNAPTQLHILLHNEIYSINGVISFFVCSSLHYGVGNEVGLEQFYFIFTFTPF